MNAIATNVVLYSLQIAAVVACASVAEALIKVEHPRLRLAYWRIVALLCVALPLLGSLTPTASGAVAVRSFVASSGAGGVTSSLAPAGVRSVLPIVLAAGALVRIGFLLFGLLRLRRLRESGVAVTFGSDHLAAVSAIAPRAEFRWDDRVAQPVTFGCRHPLVLLPPCVRDLPGDQQRAVVLHEAWHVARRDWWWLVIEQFVQAVFWFHPGVWWTADRIQLAREQVIDALVLQTTGNRRAYLKAIAAFAERSDVAFAAAFIGRRHLMPRVKAIVGAQPSMRRSIGAVLALVAVTGTSAVGASAWFPLERQGADDKIYEAGNGVTLPVVVKEVRPQYTVEGLAARIQGSVVMSCVVSTNGEPEQIAVTQSLDKEHGLDEAAVEALKQWRFKPGMKDGKTVRVRVHIEMTFTMK